MSEALPVVHLVRQGEAAWNPSGQHTGRADLPLTERGERNARARRSAAGPSFRKASGWSRPPMFPTRSRPPVTRPAARS